MVKKRNTKGKGKKVISSKGKKKTIKKKVSKVKAKSNKKNTRQYVGKNKTISLTLKTRCNPFALGYTLAILFSACVLLYSIFGLMGIFLEVVKIMQTFLFSYSLTVVGIIVGIAEAAIWGLLLGLVGAKLYNLFSN